MDCGGVADSPPQSLNFARFRSGQPLKTEELAQLKLRLLILQGLFASTTPQSIMSHRLVPARHNEC